MKSPFPGMDPYLERYWGSVHGNLLTCIQESLQPRLPRDLRARQEQEIDAQTNRKHRWVQIIDLSRGNEVVTVIEILSPAVSPVTYCRKLDSYAKAGVSVIEIGLLRYPARGRMHFAQIDLPPNLRHPYLVGLRRGPTPEEWLVFPMSLRQPLKSIPIPLRRHDPEVMLDLQSLIERTYITGGHDDIDYSKPPDPPLEPDDAAWAKTLLENRIP